MYIAIKPSITRSIGGSLYSIICKLILSRARAHGRLLAVLPWQSTKANQQQLLFIYVWRNRKKRIQIFSKQSQQSKLFPQARWLVRTSREPHLNNLLRCIHPPPSAPSIGTLLHWTPSTPPQPRLPPRKNNTSLVLHVVGQRKVLFPSLSISLALRFFSHPYTGVREFLQWLQVRRRRRLVTASLQILALVRILIGIIRLGRCVHGQNWQLGQHHGLPGQG